METRRHLDRPSLERALEDGRVVQQLLGFRELEGGRVIRWIELWTHEGEHLVALREVHEIPGETGDVTELPPVEEEDGGGDTWREFASLEEALGWVEGELGGSRERFVPLGRLQDEYLDAMEELPEP